MRISILFILFTLLGCDSPNSISDISSNNPGVILTFDDNSVDDWIKADSIYSKRDWKATFNVSNFIDLDENQQRNLLKLQERGNEIAFHGTHHIRAAYYLKEHSPEEYLDYEIIPGLTKMDKMGFHISSFAYPGGVRNAFTDSLLFNFFTVLRGTTFLAIPPSEQKCFTTIGGYKKLVYAIGLDNHYEHMHLDYIESLLQYAVDENKIVLFYGHHIEDDDTTKYVTSYKTLNFICDFIEKHRLNYYTLSEVVEK